MCVVNYSSACCIKVECDAVIAHKITKQGTLLYTFHWRFHLLLHPKLWVVLESYMMINQKWQHKDTEKLFSLVLCTELLEKVRGCFVPLLMCLY